MKRSHRKEILFIGQEHHVCQNSKLFDSVFDHFGVIPLSFVNDDQIGVRRTLLHGVLGGRRRGSRVTRFTGVSAVGEVGGHFKFENLFKGRLTIIVERKHHLKPLTFFRSLPRAFCNPHVDDARPDEGAGNRDRLPRASEDIPAHDYEESVKCRKNAYKSYVTRRKNNPHNR